MSYNILGVNQGHNGSVCLLIDGKIEFYVEEERLTRLKYDANPFRGMLLALESHPIDEIILSPDYHYQSRLPWSNENACVSLARKFNPNIKVSGIDVEHHISHAASAFYGSGFDDAVAIIVDGSGSFHTMELNGVVSSGWEIETIYDCSYPCEFNVLYKAHGADATPYYADSIRVFDDSAGIVKTYEAVTNYLGFGYLDGGKTMGLAPYGSYDGNIGNIYYDGRGDKNKIVTSYPGGAYIDLKRNAYLENKSVKFTQEQRNLAWHVQEESKNLVVSLIKYATDITGKRNVVIAGGYGLNCVSNYQYLKEFPNLNFYVDPVSHDGGTAIGYAKYAWYKYLKDNKLKYTKDSLNTLYLGPSRKFEIERISLPSNFSMSYATYEDVAKLLKIGEIVTIFQSKCEAGPRALGNRSILFDPRVINGKDIINGVKHREWFRPFAGSVLEEHASQWFDLQTLTSSPFMMYAVDVLPDKRDVIPSITHVDGTCRIQTVNRDQNLHYYRLIEAFFKLTKVPILFNTSFNLAGDPLVETIDDAIDTLKRSDLKYIYLPEINKIITKES